MVVLLATLLVRTGPGLESTDFCADFDLGSGLGLCDFDAAAKAALVLPKLCLILKGGYGSLDISCSFASFSRE